MDAEKIRATVATWLKKFEKAEASELLATVTRYRDDCQYLRARADRDGQQAEFLFQSGKLAAAEQLLRLVERLEAGELGVDLPPRPTELPPPPPGRWRVHLSEFGVGAIEHSLLVDAATRSEAVNKACSRVGIDTGQSFNVEVEAL